MEKSRAMVLLSLGLLIAISHTVLASDPELTTDFDVTNPTAANFTFTFNAQEQGQGKAVPFFAQVNGNPPFPGLTGLGLTAVIFEFGPYSQVSPHHHPRATEIFYLIEGTVDVGFVDTTNTLFAITLQAGQLFVFPKGTLHFQRNNRNYKASGFSALSSENPGIIMAANTLFTASGIGLPDSVLETAFGAGEYTIDSIKKSLSSPSSR